MKVRDRVIQAVLRKWYCSVGAKINTWLNGIVKIVDKFRFTRVRQCKGNLVLVNRRCEENTMFTYCDGHQSIKDQIKNIDCIKRMEIDTYTRTC